MGRSGKKETIGGCTKVAILLLFIGTGLADVKAVRIAPGSWSPPLQLTAGALVWQTDDANRAHEVWVRRR